MSASVKISIALLAVSFIFCACKKDKNDPEPDPSPTPTPAVSNGPLVFDFSARTETAALVFGQKFTNANNDTITITKFKYFISNIVLTKEDNSTYTVPENYHVIDHGAGGKQSFTVTNVPGGSYKAVRFMIGVDSARNKSGAQTGGLDPAGEAADMYWSWNTGYIMFKIEGTSPQSGNVNKGLEYHIGGFGGVNKTQRNINLGFGSPLATVAQDKTPKLYFNSKITEFFKTPTTINVANYYSVVSTGSNAKMFADNYADMIVFDHLSN
jgi:hypothetical protein